MTTEHICPRREEDGTGPGSPYFESDNKDTYRGDDTCSYCGSLNPDIFMEWLEAGDVELTPTDKNYKVYVEGSKARSHTKFYFQHLSPEQKMRFVALMNANALRLAEPGHFYVLPFFASKK